MWWQADSCLQNISFHFYDIYAQITNDGVQVQVIKNQALNLKKCIAFKSKRQYFLVCWILTWWEPNFLLAAIPLLHCRYAFSSYQGLAWLQANLTGHFIDIQMMLVMYLYKWYDMIANQQKIIYACKLKFHFPSCLLPFHHNLTKLLCMLTTFCTFQLIKTVFP